ncbi:MAG: serine/threonine-protein kinase [Vicinamibacterales bacterium]
MTGLSDRALAHLRDVADWPDLGERYEVTGRLGRGGTGVVFAARDRVLARDVAVKVVDAHASGEEALRRLEREARVLARLEHPGVVPVHDAGRLPDGRWFYAMKLVRGERLDRALSRAPSVGERLALVLRVADAVSFAHAAGIVHCDLTPANVMVGTFGEVLVMDWGAAVVMTDDAGASGLVVGTPGFMPPEQASGAAGTLDPRADVYGLGALLRAVIPDPVPRPLAAIIARATAPDAADRYQAVAALAADLVRFRDGARVAAYRESWREHLARVYRRYRVPIWLVAAYVLMRVALLLWFGR